MRRAHNRARNGNAGEQRRLLLEKKSELVGNLGYTRFDTLACMGRVAEEDQAQISHDEFISLQCNSMDYENLRMVEEALERLETGEYGVCQSCEEPISERRLKVVPWAKYCVVCQDQASEASMSGAALAPAGGMRL